MSPYTEEEWSRVLSAHASGQLVRGGRNWIFVVNNVCCVNQAAFTDACRISAKYDHSRRARAGAAWFDRNYYPSMTAEELIAGIEEAHANGASP